MEARNDTGWGRPQDDTRWGRTQDDRRYKIFNKKGDSHKRRDSHLFYLPPVILKMLFRIAGKSEELEKLTGSLLVNSSKIRNLLGWKAPWTLEEGIKEMVLKNKNAVIPI